MQQTKTYAFFLSLLVGFISLSSEILWVRIASYSFKSLPQVFSIVLILFLSGIALGSLYGKDYCTNKKHDLYKISFYLLLISSITDILFLYIAFTINLSYLMPLLALAIFFSAFVKSIIFPIAHHLGTSSKKVGSSVSFIYFGNIIGSTLGPIFTGFILLEYFTTINTFFILSIITIFIAILSYTYISKKGFKEIISLFGIISIIICLNILLKNQNLSLLLSKQKSVFTIENRHGIIDVFENEKKDKIVFGSGMYDGAINTDLYNDINGIRRAYRIAAFNNPLENILVIGLSTGSWLKVISNIPSIKKITVVEINPGYIKLLKKYQLNSLLENKKIDFIYDDGRRWLKRNPNKKFDAIITNTTWHFRNNVSNLLSKEFYQLAKSRMTKNGFIFYNPSFSLEAFKTPTLVFKHVDRYTNFIVASDIDVRLKKDLAIERLLALKDENNNYIFDKYNKKDLTMINKILDIPLESFEEFSKNKTSSIITISDKNPVNEYERGYIYYDETKNKKWGLHD